MSGIAWAGGVVPLDHAGIGYALRPGGRAVAIVELAIIQL
jgi:hypothetical protein